MAAFQKRSGNWRAIIRRKGFPPISRTFDSLDDAKTWAGETEAKMRRGLFVDQREAEATTLHEALERYEREITPKKKGAVQEQKRITAWKRDPLALRSLAAIRGADIAAWRDKRLAGGASPTTVRNDLALISHLFNTAAKEWGLEGLLTPIERIKMPAPAAARDRRLDPRPDDDGKDEEARLIEAAQAEWRWLAPIIRIALETAMRQGEILSLRWENIDLERRVARLPDTKNDHSRRDRSKGRDVPLSSAAVSAFRSLFEGGDGVKRLPTGEVFPVSAQALDDHWRKVVKAAGSKDLRFHDLRHEATSRLFEKGLNPMEAAAVTGHKTLAMLKRYTHLRAEDLASRLG